MNPFRLLRFLLLSAYGIAASVSPLYSATLIVSTTSDSGPGSLRQAILDANAMPGDVDKSIAVTVCGDQVSGGCVYSVSCNTGAYG